MRPTPARFGAHAAGHAVCGDRRAARHRRAASPASTRDARPPAQAGSDAAGRLHPRAGRPRQSLVFRETARAIAAYDGHHVQVTVADFSGVHRRLLERGLITEESNPASTASSDIVDPDTRRAARHARARSAQHAPPDVCARARQPRSGDRHPRLRNRPRGRDVAHAARLKRACTPPAQRALPGRCRYRRARRSRLPECRAAGPPARRTGPTPRT